MNKRNSVFKDFEAVYLRAKCAKKAFINKDEVAKLTMSPQFEKCSRHIARKTFLKNKDMLLKHGFDIDDMTNIARVFAIESLNYPFEGKTEKDNRYIFLKYINGKMDTFLLSVRRRFFIKESHIELSLDEVFKAKSGEDREDLVYANIQAYTPFEYPGLDDEELGVYVSKEDVTKKYKLLRKELHGNIEKYSDRLAELATSKITEFQARKKARTLCKTYGIDYNAWALKQILNNKLDRHDLILE